MVTSYCAGTEERPTGNERTYLHCPSRVLWGVVVRLFTEKAVWVACIVETIYSRSEEAFDLAGVGCSMEGVASAKEF